MPIHTITKNGKHFYKWGRHGKIYRSRAQAVRQAQAAHASGFTEAQQEQILKDLLLEAAQTATSIVEEESTEYDIADPRALSEIMKQLHAENVVLTYQAKAAHWNVEGSNFPQYHELLATIYQDYDGTEDRYAETVRMLKDFPCPDLHSVLSTATLNDGFDTVTTDPRILLQQIYTDTEAFIEMLKVAYTVAEEQNDSGVSGFLQERIEAASKVCWKLRSTLSRV